MEIYNVPYCVYSVWRELRTLTRVNIRLVFGTGGIRIISGIGVLRELERKQTQIVSVAGCSAGSLLAALVASGKTSEEIWKFICATDFQKVAGKKSWPWQMLIGPCSKYKTNGLTEAVCDEIGGNPKLREFPIPLSFAVVDILNLRTIVYSSLNPDTWDMKLRDVLRQAVAVPGLYPMQFVEGKLIVDGAFSTQLYLALLAEKGEEELSIAVTCHVPARTSRPSNIRDFMARTIEASIAINDRFLLERLTELKIWWPQEVSEGLVPLVQWIEINVQNIQYDQFNLSRAEKEAMMVQGEEAARNHLLEGDQKTRKPAYSQSRPDLLGGRIFQSVMKVNKIHVGGNFQGQMMQDSPAASQQSGPPVEDAELSSMLLVVADTIDSFEEPPRAELKAALNVLEGHLADGQKSKSELSQAAETLSKKEGIREQLMDIAKRTTSGVAAAGIIKAIEYVTAEYH